MFFNRTATLYSCLLNPTVVSTQSHFLLAAFFFFNLRVVQLFLLSVCLTFSFFFSSFLKKNLIFLQLDISDNCSNSGF